MPLPISQSFQDPICSCAELQCSLKCLVVTCRRRAASFSAVFSLHTIALAAVSHLRQGDAFLKTQLGGKFRAQRAFRVPSIVLGRACAGTVLGSGEVPKIVPATSNVGDHLFGQPWARPIGGWDEHGCPGPSRYNRRATPGTLNSLTFPYCSPCGSIRSRSI